MYSYGIGCLRSDSHDTLDQYMKYLNTELEGYSSQPSPRDLNDEEDNCSIQSIDSIVDLDMFANAFSGNIELNDSISASFSKIFELLVRPSSIVLIISIVVTGMVLNSIIKVKKSSNMARKDFSQLTRERTLRKQNHRCVYCRNILMVIDYHHKNGNRSDNSENNCQALCPNCHALKTRN